MRPSEVVSLGRKLPPVDLRRHVVVLVVGRALVVVVEVRRGPLPFVGVHVVMTTRVAVLVVRHARRPVVVSHLLEYLCK